VPGLGPGDLEDDDVVEVRVVRQRRGAGRGHVDVGRVAAVEVEDGLGEEAFDGGRSRALRRVDAEEVLEARDDGHALLARVGRHRLRRAQAREQRGGRGVAAERLAAAVALDRGARRGAVAHEGRQQRAPQRGELVRRVGAAAAREEDLAPRDVRREPGRIRADVAAPGRGEVFVLQGRDHLGVETVELEAGGDGEREQQGERGTRHEIESLKHAARGRNRRRRR
jgi:hypothetical protein